MRPFDRKADLLKINLKIPKHFDSTLKKEKISFCQVKMGGFETRTKCIKNIPLFNLKGIEYSASTQQYTDIIFQSIPSVEFFKEQENLINKNIDYLLQKI